MASMVDRYRWLILNILKNYKFKFKNLEKKKTRKRDRQTGCWLIDKPKKLVVINLIHQFEALICINLWLFVFDFSYWFLGFFNNSLQLRRSPSLNSGTSEPHRACRVDISVFQSLNSRLKQQEQRCRELCYALQCQKHRTEQIMFGKKQNSLLIYS